MKWRPWIKPLSALSVDDLHGLLGPPPIQEGLFLEYKRDWTSRQVARSTASFANSPGGGTVVVGVEGMEERRLKVLEGEKETQGQTAEDPDGAPVRVVVGADSLAFERGFLNTLNGDDVIETTRPKPVARITFDDAGCTYGGPTSLPSELVAVSLDNPTATPWGVAVVSIGEGHTYADIEILLEGFTPQDEPPPWVGLASIDESAPGTKTLAAWSLEPGSYGVICASDDGSTIRAVVELVSG